MSLVSKEDYDKFLAFILKTEKMQHDENPMPTRQENISKLKEYRSKIEKMTDEIARREGIK